MIILLLIISVIAVVALIKWISYFYGLAGMIHYMEENNMKSPTDEEIKKAINWAFTSSINSFKNKLIGKYKFLKLKYFTRIRH
jgi:hypothetical protein